MHREMETDKFKIVGMNFLSNDGQGNEDAILF